MCQLSHRILLSRACLAQSPSHFRSEGSAHQPPDAEPIPNHWSRVTADRLIVGPFFGTGFALIFVGVVKLDPGGNIAHIFGVLLRLFSSLVVSFSGLAHGLLVMVVDLFHDDIECLAVDPLDVFDCGASQGDPISTYGCDSPLMLGRA